MSDDTWPVIIKQFIQLTTEIEWLNALRIDKAIVTAKFNFDNSEFATILLTAGLDAFCRHRLKYCSSFTNL